MLRDITQAQQIEEALQNTNTQLQDKLKEIQSLQERLKEQAVRDSLTGLYNRHYLEETLERELAKAERQQQPVGFAMIDIDSFKNINDAYGHEAGDFLLQALSNLLRSTIRTGDIACRYGGEEYVMVLPGASRDIILQRAETWRSLVEKIRVPYQDKLLQVTISIGVAVYPEAGATPADLLRAADQAMYAAKTAGRNCVRAKE